MSQAATPPPQRILRCALPTPLNRLFDYLPPADGSTGVVGGRVSVPFGRQQLVGMLIAFCDESDVPANKLKAAHSALDNEPLLDATSLRLLNWAANFYQHPLGDTIFNFLPSHLRQGRPASLVVEKSAWRLSSLGKGLPEDALKRARKQAELLKLLQQQDWADREQLKALGIGSSIIKALKDKDILEEFQIASGPAPKEPCVPGTGLTLNAEQAEALQHMQANLSHFSANLLDGITGSGKTEVYLQAIAEVINNGRQALVLVPEIGLTPQMQARFQSRFGDHVVCLHSGLNDAERLQGWLQARDGHATVVIGTRSALLTPFPNLGLIVIDEEHDHSFKQQDGLRYSARDLAIKRAQLLNIPIILGSATPSVETLYNASQGKMSHLKLRERAAGAVPPSFEIIDTRELQSEDGLSEQLLQAIRRHLANEQQVLVFINRRGYAPTLICRSCGWIAQCDACEARLTAHSVGHRLNCHHCGFSGRWPEHCPNCNRRELQGLGMGTQRMDRALALHFPDTKVIRVDRDTTARKGELEEKLAEVATGEPCILVGTQMLAKGHHFPKLSLVVILDADAGIFSADFRGPERMAQTLTQVAGRAGREGIQGEVVVQSQLPDHPMLHNILHLGYGEFSQQLLEQRELQGLPPVRKLVCVHAEDDRLDFAMQVLEQIRDSIVPLLQIEDRNASQLIGPTPATLVRRAHRFRAQLNVFADNTAVQHRLLVLIRHFLDTQKIRHSTRVAIDVNPIDGG
jgi:primosomal protein N' (replication factor Y)